MPNDLHRIARKARRFAKHHKHLQGKAKFKIESADSAGRLLKEYENILLPNMASAINRP